MRLDYFWVENYRNIKDQEFNLGSEYIYYFEKEGRKTYLRRKTNPRFIRGFFNINGKGLENVSAIIGENASGKTNTLSFLRGFFTGDHSFDEDDQHILVAGYVLIFSYYDEHGKYRCYIHNDSERIFEIDFVYDRRRLSLKRHEVIYYSPIYDFSNYPVRNSYPSDIDISSNFLIHKDAQEQGFLKSNPVEYHKFQNVFRQAQFVQEFQTDSHSAEIINIPEQIDIIIYDMDFPNRTDLSETRNVPYAFRRYYDAGAELWEKEINYIAKAYRKNDRSQIIKFYSFFLMYLWRNLFDNLDKTNLYLSEGRVSMELDDMLKKAQDFEDFIKIFLEKQNILEEEAIVDFMLRMKSLFINREVLYADCDGNDYKTLTIPTSKVKPIIQSYTKYLEILGLAFNDPGGFMTLNWSKLSTGEKAYLDLLSRLYYAHQLLLDKVKSKKEEGKESSYPRKILLLIDEGELGFHLQWQKEFIYRLIKLLPDIFTTKEEDHAEIRPEIQLILTSHSPITLSDIPDGNIIYMQKTGRKAEVLNGVKRPSNASFGANINDLLYNAFYLKEGFIGHFSKYKIELVFKWYEGKIDISPTEIKDIIDTIDEPIVKTKLSELYANKMGVNAEILRLNIAKRVIEDRLKKIQDNDKN